MSLPRGYTEADLLYEPLPLFTWLRCMLYKQAHMSANQNGIAYCGRDFFPPDQWWIENYAKFGFPSDYWVVEDKRKGSHCGDCAKGRANHLKREKDDNRGYWEAPRPVGEPVISLSALARLSKDGLL